MIEEGVGSPGRRDCQSSAVVPGAPGHCTRPGGLSPGLCRMIAGWKGREKYFFYIGNQRFKLFMFNHFGGILMQAVSCFFYFLWINFCRKPHANFGVIRGNC